jgi:hypothetical protein
MPFIIQIKSEAMKRRIIRIDEGLLAYIGKNEYQINIVTQDKSEYQIKSEEKIVHCVVLETLRKSYMQKNSVVNYCYLMIVDRRFTWTVFRVKSNREEPEQIYTGTILSEKHELNRIIGIVEIERKVVIVFNQFKLVYLTFPEEDKPQLQIFSKEFIPYGQQPEF